MKKLIKDKATGIALAFLSMAIFVIISMIYITITEAKNMNAYQDIENITHKYLLSTEYDGGLNMTQYTQLKKELENLNIKNVDLTGSTLTADNVQYGEDIVLQISGTIKLMSNPLLTGKLHENKNFVIRKIISSKY